MQAYAMPAIRICLDGAVTDPRFTSGWSLWIPVTQWSSTRGSEDMLPENYFKVYTLRWRVEKERNINVIFTEEKKVGCIPSTVPILEVGTMSTSKTCAVLLRTVWWLITSVFSELWPDLAFGGSKETLSSTIVIYRDCKRLFFSWKRESPAV